MIYFIYSTCKSLTHVVMKPESDRFTSQSEWFTEHSRLILGTTSTTWGHKCNSYLWGKGHREWIFHISEVTSGGQVVRFTHLPFYPQQKNSWHLLDQRGECLFMKQQR